MGLNLAPRGNAVTGIATIEDNKIRTFSVYKDNEILEIINRFKPEVIAIDCPLAVIEKEFRSAEKEMQQLGYLPKKLNSPELIEKEKRASSIKYTVENIAKVIECDIDITKKVLGVNNVKELKNVRFLNIVKNEHESNAVFAAVTALFYKEGAFEQFGDEEDGYIIVPKIG